MKYVCIHGHFYQPPRENPWLEAIEQQDSAYPYHDWNERVTAESYSPNASARILDPQNRIVDITNNYRDISFNFGPTLLSWFEEKRPDLHTKLVEADRASIERWGHGSAMAQVFNHLIMPLANSRDKETQILWGIADFKHRYGRAPEGMWLAETAVDSESLDLMAKHGIEFTVLAPRQAKAIRKTGNKNWIDVTGGRVNPRRPYLVTLPSGRTITIFFYDGPVSQAVAFEFLLNSGDRFASRLAGAFGPPEEESPLVHIATDGETYGHHHRFGEMALAFALHYLDESGSVSLINYASYLAKHPARWEAMVLENTAWSCTHGVQRWADNCGCNTGAHPGWNQRWRKPLRTALDLLRDTADPLFEKEAQLFLADPWRARNRYIQVMLDRSDASRQQFLQAEAATPLDDDQQVRVWTLLELARNLQLMYTSCGWFFDEISGIEATQVLCYAARVIQLVQQLFGIDLEPEFLAVLATAPSNVPEFGDGANVYLKKVKPAVLDLAGVAAHVAIMSIFRDMKPVDRLYCFEVSQLSGTAWRTGKLSLVVGRVHVKSMITLRSGTYTYSALHLGDHNISCGVTGALDATQYQTLHDRCEEAFQRSDLDAAVAIIDDTFREPKYTMRSLFKDDQRSVVSQVMTSTIQEAENAYRKLFDEYEALFDSLSQLEVPLPKAFSLAATFALNTRLRDELEAPVPDPHRLKRLLEAAHRLSVELDVTMLEFTIRTALEAATKLWTRSPSDVALMRHLSDLFLIAALLPFKVDWWHVQNDCFFALKAHGITSPGDLWMQEAQVLAARAGIVWPIEA